MQLLTNRKVHIGTRVVQRERLQWKICILDKSTMGSCSVRSSSEINGATGEFVLTSDFFIDQENVSMAKIV